MKAILQLICSILFSQLILAEEAKIELAKVDKQEVKLERSKLCVIQPRHMQEWLKYYKDATGQAFTLSRLGRNKKGGNPWFDPERSLEIVEGKLVAVKYFMSFHNGGITAIDAHQTRLQNGTATNAVRYDLKTKKWAVISPSIIAPTKMPSIKLEVQH